MRNNFSLSVNILSQYVNENMLWKLGWAISHLFLQKYGLKSYT